VGIGEMRDARCKMTFVVRKSETRPELRISQQVDRRNRQRKLTRVETKSKKKKEEEERRRRCLFVGWSEDPFSV
jgi:hypothetical protein